MTHISGWPPSPLDENITWCLHGLPSWFFYVDFQKYKNFFQFAFIICWILSVLYATLIWRQRHLVTGFTFVNFQQMYFLLPKTRKYFFFWIYTVAFMNTKETTCTHTTCTHTTCTQTTCTQTTCTHVHKLHVHILYILRIS